MQDGLVYLDDYDELLKSSEFKSIEKFSDNFINKVGSKIKSYNVRWVGDPLHQWSRQWEYLYIINKAKKAKKGSSVLDLGAGISFLPFYLKSLGLKDIIAVDYDRSLAALYKSINKRYSGDVSFSHGDMRDLKKFKDASMDYIYSVSVLEHTNAYAEIIREVHRILKPGGKFSVTFDISIDGLDDIPVDRACKLVADAEKVFGEAKLNLKKELKMASKEKLVTSRLMASRDKRLMPWKYPIVNVVKPILKQGKLGSKYKNLTFCCLTFTK